MKKLLLLGFILSTSFLSAQLLQSENFNDLQVGDVGTDLTGEMPGEGDFLTYGSPNEGTTTNLSNSNFQITSTISDRENVFTLEGANGTSGSRYMWKGGLADSWDARTEGNDLIVASVEINPGIRGESENTFGLTIYDQEGYTIVAFSVDSNTGELWLIAYAGSGEEEGLYRFSLGSEGEGLYLPENEWSQVTIAFDYSTGEVLLIYGEQFFVEQGNSAGYAPFEVDFVASASINSPNTNAVSATMRFDNLFVDAISTEPLAVKNNELSAGLKVYPNPTTDVLNITLDNKSINSVSISDLNGRIVKKQSFDNISKITMNVSDLAAGVYMMSITSDKGTATKKIIKN